jgi:hypothetical protein
VKYPAICVFWFVLFSVNCALNSLPLICSGRGGAGGMQMANRGRGNMRGGPRGGRGAMRGGRGGRGGGRGGKAGAPKDVDMLDEELDKYMGR